MPVKITNEYSGSYIKKSSEQEKSLVGTFLKKITEPRDKLILLLLIETGITPKELVNLTPKDIDFSKRRLIIRPEITKNKRQREVTLNKKCLIFLKKFKNSKKPYLISTKKSDKANVRTIQRTIEKFSKIIGKKLTSVDLRKQFIIKSLKEKTISQVKQEAGLKRLDKRDFLNKQQTTKLKSVIKSKRDRLIFDLLISGIKSNKITKLTIEEITTLKISASLINELKKFVLKRQLHRHDFVFLTRQNSHLTNARIFQIIKEIGENAGIKTSPRILNNTALANAISAKNSERKLNALGVKTRAFHLHGNFIKDES